MESQNESTSNVENVLNLPPNASKMDAIRAYAEMKCRFEQKIRDENVSEEEVRDMENTIMKARNQCIYILGMNDGGCCQEETGCCGGCCQEESECCQEENECCGGCCQEENECCQEDNECCGGCCQEDNECCQEKNTSCQNDENTLCKNDENVLCQNDEKLDVENKQQCNACCHDETDSCPKRSLEQSDLKHPEETIIVQDFEEKKKGLCGFGWFCF